MIFVHGGLREYSIMKAIRLTAIRIFESVRANGGPAYSVSSPVCRQLTFFVGRGQSPCKYVSLSGDPHVQFPRDKFLVVGPFLFGSSPPKPSFLFNCYRRWVELSQVLLGGSVLRATKMEDAPMGDRPEPPSEKLMEYSDLDDESAKIGSFLSVTPWAPWRQVGPTGVLFQVL